jgi:hypothetical protein
VSPVSIFGAGAATAAAGVALGAGAAVSQNAVPALSKMRIVDISILFTALFSFYNFAISCITKRLLYYLQTLCQDALLMAFLHKAL